MDAWELGQSKTLHQLKAGQANTVMYEIGVGAVPLVLLGNSSHNQLVHHWEQYLLHSQPPKLMAVDLVGPFPESDSVKSCIMISLLAVKSYIHTVSIDKLVKWDIRDSPVV